MGRREDKDKDAPPSSLLLWPKDLNGKGSSVSVATFGCDVSERSQNLGWQKIKESALPVLIDIFRVPVEFCFRIYLKLCFKAADKWRMMFLFLSYSFK